MRYKRQLRCAVAKRKQSEAKQFHSEQEIHPLDVEGMEDAEEAIVKAVQSRTFHNELLSLASARKEVKLSSRIVKLDPILVNGVISVGGRLHNSYKARSQSSCHTPSRTSRICCHYTSLSPDHLITGVEHILSLIRLKYWITQARVSIRQMLSSVLTARGDRRQ